jgi:2-methylcitrate dehydratase
MLKLALEVEGQTNTVSLVIALAEYAASFPINSESAIDMARRSLIDALGRSFEALRDPDCASLAGPLVPGAVMPGGARVPGTSLELDPAQAAFCTALILCRSGDANPWLALRSGHAPDSLGAILAVADYQARKATMEGKPPPKVRDVLVAIVKALEIQGVLAFVGGHHEVEIGIESIRLVRVAAAALVTAQLGGTLGQIVTAASYACIDGGMVLEGQERYDIGRRSWATADAINRAVRHACQTMARARASYLTAIDLEAVDLAGRLLGAKPSTARNPFGSEIIDQLVGLCEPDQVAQLTTRFRASVDRYFPPRQAERVKALFAAPERLDGLPFNELIAALVTNGAR